MTDLVSSKEVIGALGGTRAVADLTGSKYGAVWHWNKKKLPANTYCVIQEALKERGFNAPSSLWKMKVKRA